MKIREMKLIARVAETGSMTLAAQQLHLTPAAVSAAVQRIEQTLGIRIFERTTRTLHPTEEGRVVIEGFQEMNQRWQRILEDINTDENELEGSVHISAPADTTYQVLSPVVASLSAQHPKLHIVLHTSDAVQHLHKKAIDMAIRYGPLQDSTLSARKLSKTVNILVASPTYLDAHGAPSTLESLIQHRCLTLHLSNVPTRSWELQQQDSTSASIVTPTQILCADGFLARQWAVAGMGIALKSLFDVIDDLEEGRLVRVLPTYTGGNSAIHAVFPSRRFLPARTRALDHAITTCFAARSERCVAWLQQNPS